jgi:hypothetical protein
MSGLADYDVDILLWSERQAALLRDLRMRARDVPNELDLENVAEEIESVGRSERRAFESHLRVILVHLIKYAANSSPDLRRIWAAEIRAHQFDAVEAQTPSMLERLDVERLWRRAVAQAERELLEHGDEPPDALPATMPIDVRILLEEKMFEIEPLLSLIAPPSREG